MEDLGQTLLDYGFDPSAKTIFVKEGTTMYLDDEANGKTVTAVASLMKNPESVLWVDYVCSELFRVRKSEPTVDAFLDSMERLGEPFIFGIEDLHEWFARFGLVIDEDIETGKYFPNLRDEPVYPLYRFAVGRRAT